MRVCSWKLVGLLALMPHVLPAQDAEPLGGVRVVAHDDGMESWVYAFARADVGPISDIDGRAISFDRDPSLLFLCVDGQVTVVYRFDTELYGENEAVQVQYRFDDRPASEREAWPLVFDPRATAEMEAGVAALGADSANPFLQMMSSMSDAASISAASRDAFLQAAMDAAQVTVRVTDPVDGETHTDVFPLVGFAQAIDRVTARCLE